LGFPWFAAWAGAFVASVLLGSDARAQGGSDACAAAVAIAGAGPFAFDNTAATTGAEGQANASCLVSGQTGISNDVWFAWTAATTGDVTLSLCGGTGIDTKVAVYAGGACPGGAPLVCNDDSCGAQSQVTFTATAGTTYTVQLGGAPGTSTGQGTFTIVPAVPPYWDRGVEGLTLTLVPGTTDMYQVAFTAVLWATSGVAPGADLSMQLQLSVNGVVQPGGIEDWGIFELGDCAGGSLNVCPSIQCDQASDCCNSFWINSAILLIHGNCSSMLSGQGVADCGCRSPVPASLAAGPVQLTAGDIISLFVAPLPGSLPELETGNDSDTVVVPSEMLSLCSPGAVGVVPCPCGNPPAGPDRGCDNSSATGGASLSSSGLASLALDSLVFTTIDQKPTGTSVVLQGSAYSPTGVLFGAGVRCAAGSLKRLYIKSATAGSITAPTAGDPSVSARSAALGDLLAPGAQRWYQVYYRDPAPGFCGPLNTFNVTQTGAISWLP
jgi:hypothetical protein